MVYTYRLRRVEINPTISILPSSEGRHVREVHTPLSYIEYRIEMEMLRLDQLMIEYIDEYLEKRGQLRNKCMNLHNEYKGANPFDIIHGMSPEEQQEYRSLIGT